MKTKLMIPFKTTRAGHAPNGFALVVTLSLMILLTIIAVGLLTLSGISLRSSSQGQAAAEARANARLALMMAIGELQKELGPDSRISAKSGELHLALREVGTLRSIGKFNLDAARRALVVLIADPPKKSYMANVIDPEKLAFAKGSVLAINFSSLPGIVFLGSKKLTANPGQREVAKPTLESNGMYRMLVAFLDPNKKTVPCYDRYIPGNPNSRDLLFLLPDPTLGLKVFSLPVFGEME